MNKDSNIKHLDFVVIDLFSFLISFLIACLVKFDSFNLPNNEIYLNVVLWIIVIDILFIVINNPYKDVLKRSNFDEIKVTLVSTTVNLIIITIIIFKMYYGIVQSVCKEGIEKNFTTWYIGFETGAPCAVSSCRNRIGVVELICWKTF